MGTARTQNVEDLPVEILNNIFAHVDEPDSIRESRLVSKRFLDAATPYLITEASVRMTKNSLDELESLCDHPIYSKSITKIRIYVTFYDVTMAADRAQFMENCETRLYQDLEIMERAAAFKYSSRSEEGNEDEVDEEGKTAEAIQSQLWDVTNEELTKISRDSFDEALATPFQKLALRLFAMYKQRSDDQEDVRRDNEHVSRICTALAQLPGLEKIEFIDGNWTGQEELDEKDFEDLGLKRNILEYFDFAISPSTWDGTFTTAYTVVPPVEMLGELCSQLGQRGIRPRSLVFHLKAPSNLRPLKLSSEQQSALRKLVSKAQEIKLHVDGWARKGSYAENNDRPRDEMLALCSFTNNLFSAPNLESLLISFMQFPCFYETPNVSLSDILPLEGTWPRLSSVRMKYQPASMDDVKKLVELQSDTVKDLTWECAWLLSGHWDEAVEALRGFKNIETVSMKYPRGERYGTGSGQLPDVPYDEIYNYILKETDVNPLATEASADHASLDL